MISPRQYAKAIIGALIALLGALATGVTDGLTAQEWLTAAIAGLTAGGAVFSVTNAADPADPGEAGFVTSDAVGFVLAVLIVLVFLKVFGLIH